MKCEVVSEEKRKMVFFNGFFLLLVVLLIFNHCRINAAPLSTGDSTDLTISIQSNKAKYFTAVWVNTNEVWKNVFREQLNIHYPEPEMILYSGGVASCEDMRVTGPFYCPAQRAIYIDLFFYDELQSRFPAIAEFAITYIIAHEVGHHIQTILGNKEMIGGLTSATNEIDAYNLSLNEELQADFFAGVWARNNKNMKNLLANEGIDKAMHAAGEIGEDWMQKQLSGYNFFDSFTRGASAERLFWFKKGFETGDIQQGDIFMDPYR
jgi:predicted metalloprotease